MVRVKDGILFVKEWLQCFEKLVDEIVVVDNGSTDGTFEILKQHPKIVDIIQTEGFDEGRDKILVYNMARKRNPDWCLWLDIDEIFEEEMTRECLNSLMSQSIYNKASFRRFHFSTSNRFAASIFWLLYSANHDRYLWRESSQGYFLDSKIDNGLIQGIAGKTIRTSFRLKHLGYINKAIVDRKASIYRSVVPEKERTFEKMYLEGVKSRAWVSNRKSLPFKIHNIEMEFWLLGYFIKRAFQKIFIR
ncbi:MAG TPA: glycosyltransferase family 2 protein [Flavisolibacter sp.]|jgi:glycosyltransferase involved in cell wall biosynthesis|nr:glycosyltransferase family 2 protein [Flavisolibacter sp.]